MNRDASIWKLDAEHFRRTYVYELAAAGVVKIATKERQTDGQAIAFPFRVLTLMKEMSSSRVIRIHFLFFSFFFSPFIRNKYIYKKDCKNKSPGNYIRRKLLLGVDYL